jgi:hypothetical protein
MLNNTSLNNLAQVELLILKQQASLDEVTIQTIYPKNSNIKEQ